MLRYRCLAQVPKIVGAWYFMAGLLVDRVYLVLLGFPVRPPVLTGYQPYNRF